MTRSDTDATQEPRDTNETWRIVLHIDIKAANAQDAIKKAGSLLRPQTELRAKVRHTSVTRADQVKTYVPGHLDVAGSDTDATE